jgi:hypothetical protein
MCKTQTDLERERFFVHFLLDPSGLEFGTKLLCAEARPKFSATNCIDTYLKTDPTRRICISHYKYSELTVHKGNAQLYSSTDLLLSLLLPADQLTDTRDLAKPSTSRIRNSIHSHLQHKVR